MGVERWGLKPGAGPGPRGGYTRSRTDNVPKEADRFLFRRTRFGWKTALVILGLYALVTVDAPGWLIFTEVVVAVGLWGVYLEYKYRKRRRV